MRAPLARPVKLLGWTSLFTDAATEAIYPLLPVFVTRVLGGSAVSLGIIEGAADAVSSTLKIVAGRVSDRTGRRTAFLSWHSVPVSRCLLRARCKIRCSAGLQACLTWRT